MGSPERGLRRRDRRFEHFLISCPFGAAIRSQLFVVDREDVIDGQKEQLSGTHFASFRSVASWFFIDRLTASFTRFWRADRRGEMISDSPSVRISSSVSRSIERRSRMGLSMTSPRLFPMGESFLEIMLLRTLYQA